MDKYEEFDEFDDFTPQSQPIDIKPYFQLLFKSWKRILIGAFCGMLFGIMIGFSKPKTYTSTAIVAPELATRSTLSTSLNSLASLAGINANSMAITDAMHPDLYPVVIRSTDFYIGLFDLPVSFRHHGELIETDLFEYISKYNRTPWYSYVLGFPRLAIEFVKGLFSKQDVDMEFYNTEGYDNLDSLKLTKQQENVIKVLSRSVKTSVEKKTYALYVQATMQDRVIAAKLANAVVDHLKAFVVGYRAERAQENVDYLESLYAEAHEEYMAAQRAFAYYSDSHMGSLSRSSQVEQQRLQNEAQLKYQMYNTTAQNLLAARAKVQQESPVFVVIQQAKASQNGKPSKVRLGMLWAIIGALICIGCIWWKKG